MSQKTKSRQLIWQERMISEKRCPVCGAPAAPFRKCPKHQKIDRDYQNRKNREKRGIPIDTPVKTRLEWIPEMDSEIGKATDLQVSKRLKITIKQVTYRRNILGIKPYRNHS